MGRRVLAASPTTPVVLTGEKQQRIASVLNTNVVCMTGIPVTLMLLVLGFVMLVTWDHHHTVALCAAAQYLFWPDHAQV